jgi:hypothetical protein
MVKTVASTITGPIIDGTIMAWDGTLCVAGGPPSCSTKSTLAYAKRFYGPRGW